MKTFTFKDKIRILELMIMILPTQYYADRCICWTLSDVVSKYYGRNPYIYHHGDKGLADYIYRIFPELYWAMHLASLDCDIIERFKMKSDAEFIRINHPTHLWNLSNSMDETEHRIEFLTNVRLMMIASHPDVLGCIGN